MGDSKLDHEMNINIRLKPRRLVKGAILLLMLITVFYVGRFTAGPEEALTSASTGTVVEAKLEAPVSTEATKETEKESWTTSLTETVTGFVTGLLPDFSADESKTDVQKTETTATTGTEPTSTATTEATSNTSTAATIEAPTTAATAETAVEEEPVLTSYSKVAISLNDAIYDWKGTWGKITKIDYTIKNNEAGTVKPSYLIMLVEGYDTTENMIRKKISVPLSGQTIKAGQAYNQVANVPQGFAYNKITAGDLNDVRITLTLFDSADKQMGQFSGGFNLQGSS